MPCNGNGSDHCCYVNGERCPHSVDHAEGRRWACGLRIELGDWDAVLASTEYTRDVAPHFEPLGINCRDWPNAKQACSNCGANA